MNESTLRLILMLIIMLIIILLAFLGYIYYKEKMNNAKNQKENDTTPKKDPEKPDYKSVFRFMEFDEIEDNMIVQDNGTRFLMVVECKGINYDLLSSLEKTSVEEGFMQFLNTLKHPIQLYVQTRKVNLSQSTSKYNERLKKIKLDLDAEEQKYQEMQRIPGVSREDLLKELKELTKKRNLYDYGKDVIENTEQMAEDRDITTKQYYIVIPYYTDEITASGDYDKREISNMAFSELYTRAQSIVGALMECDVRGKILNSQEIVELLYVAYNREQYDIYDFETYMNKSGYQTLYSVSEDVLEKKMRALDEVIIEKANQRALDAFELASEERLMKIRAIEEKKQRMDEYINSLANEIVDRDSNALGKDMTKMTKEQLKKIKEKEEKTKEKINNKENNTSEKNTAEKTETKKVRKLTEEEKKRRLEIRRRKLLKEREENARKQKENS